MPEKIHCDLLEIFGPDWVNITPEQVDCLVNNIHTTGELFGEDPELFGFVGTERVDSIVGGYFAIQYEEEEFHYDKKKQLDIRYNAPFSRIFFVLFASTGKLLLQNTKFVGIPLTMPRASSLFQDALNHTLPRCKIRQSFGLASAPEETTEQEFVEEFNRSTRVIRLEVTELNPGSIPDGFEYYNPQRDRNSIIRDSHRHDYSELKKVDLEAKEGGDIKKTHLRDLMFAAKPQIMKYYVGLQEFIMRRETSSKFEFYVDMKAEELSREQLLEVIERLRRERAIYLDTPTSAHPGPVQKSMFDLFPDEEQ